MSNQLGWPGLSEGVLDRAQEILGPRSTLRHPLGPMTTYRVGGPAAIFLKVESLRDLAAASHALADTGLPVLVLGRGSNLLVADAGFPGIALTLGAEFDGIISIMGAGPDEGPDTSEPERRATGGQSGRVRVGAATYMPVLARRCAAAGLGGLEWAAGIPGSVGGGVCMNAGGHGADMKAALVGAELYDLGTGAQSNVLAGELHLGYRQSAITPSQVVLSALLAGYGVDPLVSRARIDEIVRWRRANQPGGSNAGSVFVNPDGNTAGRLVEGAGLKGLRVGSAEVSARHANFIQAGPGGSADDVARLIAEVRRRVADSTGTSLELECRLIGEFVYTSTRG
ncbi:MAG: UDP-N-acetylmuramate dehydrogenase [Acidimicrobiales bacterium]